jgi:hypothetical protein
MSIACVAEKMSPDAAARALLLVLNLALGGCVTSNAGSSPMDARAEVPAPPRTRSYLPVEDLPANRNTPSLTVDEQSKLKTNLATPATATGKPSKREIALGRPEPRRRSK